VTQHEQDRESDLRDVYLADGRRRDVAHGEGRGVLDGAQLELAQAIIGVRRPTTRTRPVVLGRPALASRSSRRSAAAAELGAGQESIHVPGNGVGVPG
jgi:hypothetical protein